MINLKRKRLIKVAVVTLLSAVLAICIAYLSYFIYTQYIIPHNNDKEVNELRDMYNESQGTEEKAPPVFIPSQNGMMEIEKEEKLESSVVDTESKDEGTEDKKEEQEEITDNSIGTLQELKKEYADVKGWIKINGTSVDYPVLQSTDNSYYLYKDYKGRYNINGSIYMDYRCSPQTQNIVIYGHNMDADVMFSSVTKYKYAEFGRNHPIIYLDFDDGYSTKWEVVGTIICTAEETSKYINESFSEETINEFLDAIEQNRRYAIGSELSTTSQYVTLVTCSYEYSTARTIVIAKRI